MMKMRPVLLPAPERPKVSWYSFMALIEPIRDESKPFNVLRLCQLLSSEEPEKKYLTR